jgi:transposase
MLPYMTVQDVSKLTGVSRGTIKHIDKSYLQKHYSKPRLKEVRRICIDEFAVQKGHKYMTTVLDADTHKVLYVGKGRDEACLKQFWKRLQSSGAKVEAVAMDMWPAYINAATNNLPNADIVVDKFHIEKNVNECLSDIRKELHRQETDLNKRKVLKGTRWLLLKNNDRLLTDKEEPQRLEAALKINEPLAKAYYLKEELKLLWSQTDIKSARKFLGDWVAKAKASGIQRMKKTANMLLSHRTGIFNWFKHQISTGPLEGINNKIKVLKRKAFGFRDMDYFVLKILSMHLNRYALF